MTLHGFKAQNHPQQTRRRGARPEVDERATDPEVFARLHRRFGFTLDVAALPHNAKCDRFFTPADDGLSQPWVMERVWCNPPYSDIEPWLEKAWAERSGARASWPWPPHPEDGAATLIVMLLPANRTEQGWWQRQVEPHRDNGDGFSVEFLPGRLRFIAHDADRIGPNERPPFGCALLIWGDPHHPARCPKCHLAYDESSAEECCA